MDETFVFKGEWELSFLDQKDTKIVFEWWGNTITLSKEWFFYNDEKVEDVNKIYEKYCEWFFKSIEVR